MWVLEAYYFIMRIKLPLFDNPTIARLHPMCAEGSYGLVEGIQLLYSFPNGFGASVVYNSINSGRPIHMPGKYTWELAVLDISPNGLNNAAAGSFSICYTTEVADDVIKPLRPTEVEMYLQWIYTLPQNNYEETGTLYVKS